MTAAVANSDSPLASAPRKKPVMEDRKRPLNDTATDETPPSKRQAVTAANVPQTQEDVVHFQKEAIYRQMQIYKREKVLAETRLDELTKRCTYHDDHLRIIDNWWEQVLDEVRILVSSKDVLEKQPQQNGDNHDRIPPTLFFADDATFSEHLSTKHDAIVDTLSSLFKRFEYKNDTDDKVTRLQKKISELLAAEKVHKVDFDRVLKDKEDVEQQLTDTAIRYLQAEKKLDRLKSVTLAKIEQQATTSGSAGQNDNSNQDSANSSRPRFTDGQLADADLARKEAEAIASKQEKEIKQLQADNTRLSEQITKFTVKLSRLSEEDITNCDAYKNTRLRLDDVVGRINHLEALNTSLQKEIESLQTERTTFRQALETEQSIAIGDANMQVSKNDADLARIRSVRDELLIENQAKRVALEKHVSYVREVNELAASRLERISSLEGEVARLRIQLGEDALAANPDIAALSHEDLVEKATMLHRQNSILEKEFKDIESAYHKAHALSKGKVGDIQGLSERIDKLNQDKTKAEQKYFQAVKVKDTAMQEVRMLRMQHNKASEIISQLKDAEKAQASLTSNLEKQLAELKILNNQATLQSKNLQTRLGELANSNESLQKQVGTLRETLKSKDQEILSEVSAKRKAENELERNLVKLDSVERTLQALSRQESENTTLEALRTMVRCGICRTRMKSTAIKTCGHVFCKECAEERIKARSRKCPNCGQPFAQTDLITVHL